MKQMKSFLRMAGELGYNGYVCFKVGASGCSNGMWAHKAESTDGFSPDCEFLYRSFTPDYTGYDVMLPSGKMGSDVLGKDTLTSKEVVTALRTLTI